METKIIKQLTNTFESFANKMDNGIEFWFARDLQHLLGYTKWDNFLNVISKAKTALETTNEDINDHFADVGKMVNLGLGSQREIDDIMLTRKACYLIAMNGDTSKEEIAFAQQYFVLQIRKSEIIEQKVLEYERIQARHKLAGTETELSRIIYEQTGDDRNFGIIRSKGDQALFGRTTAEMKTKWGIVESKPLADFMPTILLKAKDFATEITIYNAKNNKMKTEKEISDEHITNNRSVRKTLIERGIKPEDVLPEEDLKKVERRLNTDTKKGLKNSNGFNKK
ncbi:MAG: DNA damage-inducible protein D [Candidatus Gracilibacteria bacterium]|nr:DNA damage-inducible protein D [Candidatus Gracilibacteria bacterium]